MRLPENQGKCLDALLEASDCSDWGADGFHSFRTIAEICNLPVDEVRRKIRALKRRGLAEFSAGLSDLDGHFAGAGYRLTRAGRDLAKARGEVKPAGFLKGDGK